MNILNQKLKRAIRVRSKLSGTVKMPRLSVFRSNVWIYAQLIDDKTGKTILGASEKQLKDTKGTKTDRAKAFGAYIAHRAKDMKIEKAVFDRGKYRYHGRVKAFAQGAREGGLVF